MICYICHESINDYIEDYVFCNNCGNLFHEDCVNTNKPVLYVMRLITPNNKRNFRFR